MERMARNEKVDSVTLPIAGMTCNHCAERIEKELKGLKGVRKAFVNYSRGEAVIRFNPGETGIGKILKAIREVEL